MVGLLPIAPLFTTVIQNP